MNPYSFAEAREAAANAARNQRQAEEHLVHAARDHAEKERAYRVALARKITELHADGAAWSVCPDLARGESAVARLRYERDVAQGVREAAVQAAWRHAADRKDLGTLLGWSMRRDLAEGMPDAEPVGAIG